MMMKFDFKTIQHDDYSSIITRKRTTTTKTICFNNTHRSRSSNSNKSTHLYRLMHIVILFVNIPKLILQTTTSTISPPTMLPSSLLLLLPVTVTSAFQSSTPQTRTGTTPITTVGTCTTLNKFLYPTIQQQQQQPSLSSSSSSSWSLHSSLSLSSITIQDNLCTRNKNIVSGRRSIMELRTSIASTTLLSNDDNDNNKDSTVSSSNTGTGTASISNEIFNLVKGIVGAGVLSLPYGIATYGNAVSAIYPAIVLIVLLGTLSGYSFGLIGRVCSITQTTSYKSAWDQSISKQTSWIPAVAVTLKTICATLAYSMILGDTFYALSLSAGINQLSKTFVLLFISSFILLPLCLLKNLSSLAPFSLIGSMGMVYTAIAMLIRYIDQSYNIPNGIFIKDLSKSLQPSFGTIGASGVMSPVTTILLGMLSTAYMAHFNAPKFYIELKNNTIPRFMKVVTASFGISIGLFTMISTIGFLTFGSNASGLILNNYSTKDVLMSLSRIAVAISLVGSYPLAFVGARDGLIDVLGIRDKSSKTLNIITVGLLSSITFAALRIPDVSFVLAFAGYVY
jgi:amino acid permease